MRFVIDLQACQHGASGADTILPLLSALVASAGDHEVWAVLDAQAPRQEALRAALDGVLPLTRVRSYDLPASGDGNPQWRRRTAELLRAGFLRQLGADVVFAPLLFDIPAYAGISAAQPAANDPLTVFTLGVAALPAATEAAAIDAWHRQQAALRHASLVLADAAPAGMAIPTQSLPDDPAAAAALLWQRCGALLAASSAKASQTLPARRPRLAYISPLPPEQSGIADYSVGVVRELAQWYDIELVIDQDGVADADLRAAFPLRSPAWFDAHAHEFDRVVYHFGNNHMHRYMFDMLQRHPGVVVLHDFYLSGVVDQMERGGYRAGAFYNALYQSHGYTALLEHTRLGRNDSIWSFPTNKAVLDHAAGIIVHSDYARTLAEQWYGAGAADDWQVVPLPRSPAGDLHTEYSRAAARARLGLEEQDFIVCTFGMMGETKLNDELIDAFLASPLAADPRCKLVFVGQNAGTDYGQAVAQKIADSGIAERIVITGFATPETYASYAAAADIAVQLRSKTRGETSAAILDCLLYGAPTIINAHGAAADLSEDMLLKLPDLVKVDELAAALERLHADKALRTRLGQQAAAHVRSQHAPAETGRRYADAIEHFALHHPRVAQRQLLAELGRVPGAPEAAGLVQSARALVFNQPPAAQRQLFVDISALVDTDLKTGIQRVVRSVLHSLLLAPPPGFRIEPVYGSGGNRPYRYARRFTLEMVGAFQQLPLEDAPIEARHGDIFLGLDLFTNGTAQNRDLLQSMRERGVQVYFVVYDVLPVLHPEWFPHGTLEYFSIYLDSITHCSDGVVCISRAVADELAGWKESRVNERQSPLKVGYFHLGADINASKPSFGLPDNAQQVFDAVAARPSVLMVGTLEPRKGHAQALAAFDLLWEQQVDANLLIVGKDGWMVEHVTKRLAAHPERGHRLFWLAGVSDEMLLKLYQSASGLLAASEGEGFGLPLIEAAQHGIPILARDLPVFREVAGTHAHYFHGMAPAELAQALEQWLALLKAGNAPASTGLPWLSWDESAQQLLKAVIDQQWYSSMPAGPGAQA
nr:glycosyltransferase [uncultured Duganella sp.]